MLVFCLFIPFPREYTVSRGVPVFSLAMTNSVLYGMMVRGNGENGTCKMARHNAKKLDIRL